MNNISKLKIDLLCKGIKVNPNESYYSEIVPKEYAVGGKSRAGVAGSGKSFILNDKEPCNIGVLQPFLEDSPYEFKIINNEGWILKNNLKVVKATLREPAWHSTSLADEIQLHGSDSLATALSNYCSYKQEGQGCKFCIIDIGKDIIFHDPIKIAKTIKTIEQNPNLRTSYNIEDKFNTKLTKKELLSRKFVIKPKDININAGAMPDEAKIYAKTILEIRKVSDLPIFIEIGPLSDQDMEQLYSVGTNAISFNLEVFDQKSRLETIPGKAMNNSVDDYLSSMKKAVTIFGDHQVSSWILIGLEPPEKTIEGIEKIAETGAIPLPKPFRPLYGADLEKKNPPTFGDSTHIYKEWLDIIQDYSLKPLKCRAGCARCNACFPIKELLKEGI
jgi:hypothetical protein